MVGQCIVSFRDAYVAPSPTALDGSVHLTHQNRLTTNLISRFLLDLQAANEKAVACASDPYGPSDAVQTLVFERIVGSLASESASVWEESPSERESRQAAGDDENCMEHCRVSSEPDEHTANSAPGARDVESKCLIRTSV